MPSNHLILCRPLLLLPSIFPSIRVFSSESVLHIRWPKYWSFSFSLSPSNEYSGLISFRMDWLDLLAVQGTLKSLLQHHSPKATRINSQHGHQALHGLILALLFDLVLQNPPERTNSSDTDCLSCPQRSPASLYLRDFAYAVPLKHLESRLLD